MAFSTYNQQLGFLKEKIEQIGSAIFFNQSDSVLKLPTSLISKVKVDDYGYVWFFIKKPDQQIQQFENGFAVRMDFFRKGIEYFLQVTGTCWVVTDPEEINSFFAIQNDLSKQVMKSAVLVKVKMMKAEYFETGLQSKSPWWQSVTGSFLSLFRPAHIGTDTYFPAS